MSNFRLREMFAEAGKVTGKLYPSFVTAFNPPVLSGEVPVFMFHTVEYRSFREQMEFLKINGYNTIAADDIFAFIKGGSPIKSGSVMLTFDDGRKSLWTVAYPLLKEYGFKATAFIIPGCIGTARKKYPVVSWEEVKIMHEDGIMDFQSHTLNHDLNLGEISPENEAIVMDSFVKSKSMIEERLPGKKVIHLCYPYGIGSKKSVELSKKAGYVSNFWVTVENKRTNRQGDDPYYITRMKDDYLMRLPGIKRRSFIRVFCMKLLRRLGSRPLY
ncbi:MAG: polysaccharide deacetylase family protein [bacterium]